MQDVIYNHYTQNLTLLTVTNFVGLSVTITFVVVSCYKRHMNDDEALVTMDSTIQHVLFYIRAWWIWHYLYILIMTHLNAVWGVSTLEVLCKVFGKQNRCLLFNMLCAHIAEVQCRHLISTLNVWAASPGTIDDRTPDCHLISWAWMHV